MKDSWKILKEDKYILAVYKPPSLVVQGAKKVHESLFLQLKEHIKIRDKKPGNVFLAVVHRLDKPVSGVVLFAKRSKSASKLFQAMQKGDFAKVYLAMVEGKFIGGGFLIDYLKHEERLQKVIAFDKEAPSTKRALTYFESLYSTEKYSLLLLFPITGRKHQLRVATSRRGAPIIGDKLYGSKVNLGGRILLHSLFLSFPHPATGESEDIFCPVPQSFLKDVLSLTKDQRIETLFNRLDKSFILEFVKRVKFVKRVNSAKDKELVYVSSKDLAKMQG